MAYAKMCLLRTCASITQSQIPPVSSYSVSPE